MKTRSHQLDNIKGMMILLVIVGHLITQLYLDGVNGNTVTKHLYYMIYSFHMPVFIFISGYFSKNAANYDRRSYINKAISGLLVPYLVFTVLYGLIYAAAHTHKFASAFNVLRPQWTLWFLLSLFFWKVVVKPFSEKLPCPFLLSLLLSLCAGMAGFLGQTLSLARTLGFFPYFLAGYLLPEESLIQFKNKKFSPTVLFIIAMILIGFAINLDISYRTLFMRTSYANMGQSYPTGIMLRAVSLLIGFICIWFFLSVVPNKVCFLSDFGMYSITIYLAHSVIIKLLDYSLLVRIADPVVFVCFAFAFSLILCFIFGNKKIYHWYSTAMNFLSCRLLKCKNEPR